MDRKQTFEALQSAAHDQDRLYALLRTLPVDSVGEILNHVPAEYGALRRALPRMAPEDIQVSWTGAAGSVLLLQSCAFVRAVAQGFRQYTGRSLEDAVILDYGCGWGRLVRLMYKFTAPGNLHACDPWDRSLALCAESGLPGHFAQSDYLPRALPFGATRFDLIYAFSVFTHLSERAADTALAACRQSIRPDGLLVITVRPVEYWDHHDQAQNVVDRERMKRDHRARGFAFTPHHRPPIDGDVTYGDTSISEDYLRSRWQDWEMVGYDRFLQDPFQTLVFLRPRAGTTGQVED